MKKRLFSLFLAAALVLGLTPVSALALEGEPELVDIKNQGDWDAFVQQAGDAALTDTAFAVTLSASISADTTTPVNFKGTFNGQGNTITAATGTVFGTVTGTISNLIVKGGADIGDATSIQNSFTYDAANGGTVYGSSGQAGKHYDKTQFESGEVCCLLGSPWGQNITTDPQDAHPVYNGAQVYYGYGENAKCGDSRIYSNSELLERPIYGHDFGNGTGTCSQGCDATASVTININDAGDTLTAIFEHNYFPDLDKYVYYVWTCDGEEVSRVKTCAVTTNPGNHVYRCVIMGNAGVTYCSDTKTVAGIADSEARVSFADVTGGTGTKKTCVTGDKVTISISGAGEGLDVHATVSFTPSEGTDAPEGSISTDTTNANGEASLEVNTARWLPGRYDLRVYYTDESEHKAVALGDSLTLYVRAANFSWSLASPENSGLKYQPAEGITITVEGAEPKTLVGLYNVTGEASVAFSSRLAEGAIVSKETDEIGCAKLEFNASVLTAGETSTLAVKYVDSGTQIGENISISVANENEGEGGTITPTVVQVQVKNPPTTCTKGTLLTVTVTGQSGRDITAEVYSGTNVSGTPVTSKTENNTDGTVDLRISTDNMQPGATYTVVVNYDAPAEGETADTFTVTVASQTTGGVTGTVTMTGTDNSLGPGCYFGHILTITVSGLEDNNGAVLNGKVGVECNGTWIESSETDVNNVGGKGEATISLDTENDAMIPVEASDGKFIKEATLKIMYKSDTAGSASGSVLDTRSLKILLSDALGNAVPYPETGTVTRINAPSNCKICTDISSSTARQWNLSLPAAAGQTITYYVKDNEYGTVSVPKQVTISAASPGGDNTGNNTGGNTGGDNTGGNTSGDNTGNNTGNTVNNDISSSDLHLTVSDCTYTGERVTPLIHVDFNGKGTYLNINETDPKGAGDCYVEIPDSADRINVGTSIPIKITGINDFTGTVETTFKILPKSITPEIIGTPEKVYDGTKALPNASAPEVRLDGIYDKDKDSIEHSVIYEFEDPKVGNGKKVTVSLYLDGDATTIANYKLTEDVFDRYIGKITPFPLTLDKVEVNAKDYDGRWETTDIEVGFRETLPPDAEPDYEVKGVYSDANAGDRDVTVTVTLGSNFTPTTQTAVVKGKINKAVPNLVANQWPTITGFRYGMTLGDYDGLETAEIEGAGVDGTAIKGNFKWADTTIVPDAGTTKQTMIFEPISPYSGNYQNAENRNITFTVAPGELYVNEYPTAPAIEYGQTLNDSKITGGDVRLDENGSGEVITGTWTWTNPPYCPPKAGTHKGTARFTPTSNSNYALANPIDLEVEVTRSEPVISITTPSQYVKTGKVVELRVAARNPYNSGLTDVELDSVTWQIDGGEPETFTGEKYTFTVPEDAPDNATITITAKTKADAEKYIASTETVELYVTRRPVLDITVTPENATFNGKAHSGYSAITFRKTVDGKEETVELKEDAKTGYSVSWYEGSEVLESRKLESEPVEAGTYTVVIDVNTDEAVGSTALEPTTFRIEKKQLTWNSKSLSAEKAAGEAFDGEVPVSGTLGVSGVERDYPVPASALTDLKLVTDGFTDTTAGSYPDVVAVPAEGKTWKEVLEPLKNYLWPYEAEDAADPSVKATILAQAGKNEKGEILCLDIKKDTIVVPANMSNQSQSDIKRLLRAGLTRALQSLTESNLEYREVTLMIAAEDGTLTPAALSDFPESGLDVTLEYPDKVADSYAKYTFEVTHLLTTGSKSGTTEKFTENQKATADKPLTKDASGLHFKVTGLSPMLIAWMTPSGNDDKNDSNTSNNNNSNTSNTSNNNSNSSSSDEEEYRVRISSTTGGNVTTSARYAEAGDTVRLTVTPNSGYMLSSLTVTDKKDKNIRVRQSSGKYVFTMPERDVWVEATFRQTTTTSQLATTITPSTSLWSSTGSSCAYGASCPSRTFYDLNSAMWYHDPVDFVIQRGMMTGMPDGRFAPNATLSRAMIVQILYAHAGRPAVSTGVSYSDVDKGAWYEPAMNWAVSQGIAQGIGNGRFAPNAAVTREQLATMLYNYAAKRGMSLSATQAQVTFTDNASISGWATTAVSAMQRAGIISGKSGRFEPKGTATRAEAAQMLWKLLG